jgi:hypothetical protein
VIVTAVGVVLIVVVCKLGISASFVLFFVLLDLLADFVSVVEQE